MLSCHVSQILQNPGSPAFQLKESCLLKTISVLFSLFGVTVSHHLSTHQSPKLGSCSMSHFKTYHHLFYCSNELHQHQCSILCQAVQTHGRYVLPRSRNHINTHDTGWWCYTPSQKVNEKNPVNYPQSLSLEDSLKLLS